MSSSLPDGYTLRAGRPDDVDPLTAMLIAEERAIRGESQWGRPDTEDWWRGLAHSGEAWIVEDSASMIAGVLGLFQRGDLFNAWIAVGRNHLERGLGSTLVAYAEERTRVRGGQLLNLDTFGENEAARQLIECFGYAEERRHYRMQVDLNARPVEPSWPPGITSTPFDPDRDARGFHEVIHQSFEGQWGFRPMPFDEWLRFRVQSSPDFDPTLWFVAREGERIVGALRGDPNRWSCGWVGMVAVRPKWQRRGVGTALLQRAFCEFYDRGAPCVGLGVDTQNPTDATRLYERVGMRVKSETITYAKALA
jgi:mycothiol synthase